MSFEFEIIHQSKKSRARVGIIKTKHGNIETPNFVPVGTNGALKCVLSNNLFPLIFCNTYHLYLQPGTQEIAAMGGLHKFINRDRPIITDSGGFQVFSLAYGSVAKELKSKGSKQQKTSVLKINEDGVWFQSYRDGSKLFFSPEVSVQAQKDLGADIIIPFDELLPYHTDNQYFLESCARTYRWEKRSLDYHKKNPGYQSMYGVIHGGIDPIQRKLGCDFVVNEGFDGFAIGGSVGKNKSELYNVVDFTTNSLPKERPVHLLGIGDPESIDNLIGYGIDTFDSSYPTKAARHALIFSSKGPLKIDRSSYKSDQSILDETCDCYTCKQGITKAYLRHLFKAHEPNAMIWASIHNTQFMYNTMKQIRQKILDDQL